ncbi:uncharacterized protein LOC108142232 [Drosophila elegans]|uniref:uncharacterized protein LOC108142232 n=1 Tax=Drosophila elegans TaxID=30023 RepID=UPI0007E607BF|nr:uncharacterized protein LOC108142232 [Drosophila elegans]
MYECSRCGNRRSGLSLRAGIELHSTGEDYIEGGSSWCNSCGELTFFIRCHADKDFVQPLISNTLDSIDPVPVKVTAALLRGALHPRTVVQNQQAASLANHLNNWAVEAMDPPKRAVSFTTLPNRHGHMAPKTRIPDEDVPRPPITPLNVILSPRVLSDDDKTPRNSSNVKVEERKPSSSKSPRSEQVKGVERLRSIAPSHLSQRLPDEQTPRLSAANPYAKTFRPLKKTSEKPETSVKKIVNTQGPSLTLKDIKKLQRRFAADDFSGPESSAHSSDRFSAGSGPMSVEPSSEPTSTVELQKKIDQKRRQLCRLTSMRTRLDAECEATKTELELLERRNRRSQSRRSNRERGGAHIRLVKKIELENEMDDRKKLITEDKFETLLKTLHEQAVPQVKREDQDQYKELDVNQDLDQAEDQEYLGSHNLYTPSLETDTEIATESKCDAEMESNTAFASPKGNENREKDLSPTYIPLPFQLRNPFATPRTVGFHNHNVHDTQDRLQRSRPLCKSRSIQALVSTAQRARFTGCVDDPLEVVKLIKNLEDGNEVQLKAPNAQFSTVACEEQELAQLIKKKPQKAKELDICRLPVRCPDSDCNRLSFVSDFNKHLLLDHRSLTAERIQARQTKTFFLDTNMALMDQPRCHMLYLVRDKIFNTGGDDMCDLLPVMVMSARTHLSTVLASCGDRKVGASSRKQPKGDRKLFVLWLTGLVPQDLKLMATLSTWSTLGPDLADCASANTSYVYDIRAPNEMGSICQSGCSIILPMHMIKRMTDKGRRFLAIQVQVY